MCHVVTQVLLANAQVGREQLPHIRVVTVLLHLHGLHLVCEGVHQASIVVSEEVLGQGSNKPGLCC